VVYFLGHAVRHHDFGTWPLLIKQPIALLGFSSLQMGHFGRLWFMWELIIMYLLSPVLTKAFKTTKGALSLAFTLTAICLLSHGIDMYHVATTGTSMYSYDVHPWFRQTFKIWVFATYYVWGGVFGRHDVREWVAKRLNKTVAIIGMLLLTVLSVACQYGLDTWMVYNSPEFQHDSPLIILWVISIIVVGVCYREKTANTKAWLVMADCTLGIYFLHGMMAFFLKKIIPATTIGNLLILSPATFVVCLVITMVLMRMPVAKVMVNVPKIKIIK